MTALAKRCLVAGAVSLVGLVAVAGEARAVAPTISGYATNFDVPDGTDHECEGFEIDVEDISTSQVAFTWGNFHYGQAKSVTAATFADGHSGVVVTYSADFVGGAWSVATPVGAIEHFGVHVTGTPGIQRYTWLCDLGTSGPTGTLTQYGGTTIGNFYPLPVPAVIPAVVPTPAGEGIQAEVVPAEPMEPGDALPPDAVWVEKFQASSTSPADLTELMPTTATVTGTESHSQLASGLELFQPDLGNGGRETEAPDDINPGDAATIDVVRTYTYTGPYDAKHKPSCTRVAGDPLNCSNFVGPMVAQQMTSTLVDNPNPRANLDVTVVSGGKAGSTLGGSVTSDGPGAPDPALIACGLTCSASFDQGTAVTLTARPEHGWLFQKWTGACTGTNPTCTVTLSASKTVTAYFVAMKKLTVVLKGHGRVTASPGGLSCTSGKCSVLENPGAVVTLTATPASGLRFVGWSGACLGAGTSPTCTVTMTGAKSVTATFA